MFNQSNCSKAWLPGPPPHTKQCGRFLRDSHVQSLKSWPIQLQQVLTSSTFFQPLPLSSTRFHATHMCSPSMPGLSSCSRSSQPLSSTVTFTSSINCNNNSSRSSSSQQFGVRLTKRSTCSYSVSRCSRHFLPPPSAHTTLPMPHTHATCCCSGHD